MTFKWSAFLGCFSIASSCYLQSNNKVEVTVTDSCFLFAEYGTLEDEDLFKDSAITYATNFVNLQTPSIQSKTGPSIVKTVNDSLQWIIYNAWNWNISETDFLLPCKSKDTIKVFDYYFHNPQYVDVSQEHYFVSNQLFSIAIKESWQAGFGGVGSSYFVYPFNIDLSENKLLTYQDIIAPSKKQTLLKYIYSESEYTEPNSVYHGLDPGEEDFVNDDRNLEKFIITGGYVVFYIRISYRESELELEVPVSIKKMSSCFSKKLKKMIYK